VRAGVISTPRPVPPRLLPALAGAAAVAFALPVFLLAGWPVSGWALGALLWLGGQLVAVLLPRVRFRNGSLAAASVVAFGMMFRALAVMVVLVAVAASDGALALAAAGVYAIAYTLELGLSLTAYFGATP
jgi:hypothetical protein